MAQFVDVAGTVGPWFALLALVLFLVWRVVLIREFTRGDLARSGRPFTVRLWGLSIEVGAARDEPPDPEGVSGDARGTGTVR